MKTSQASLCGALTGLLLGCAICLVQEIALTDSIFRVFVLTTSGAWMGVLLLWLDQLLPTKEEHQEQSANHQDFHS